MSENGVPAAVILIVCLFVFTAAMLALDTWIAKKFGVDHTMTEGMRYIIRHAPLAWTLFVALIFLVLGGLIVHFAGAPNLFWE